MQLVEFRNKNVGSNGKVYNKNGKGVNTGRLVAGSECATHYDGDWFERIMIEDENGKRKSLRVKDVVWVAFNGEIPRKCVVFPIDRRKNNPELSNLCLIRKQDEYKFYFVSSNVYKKRMKSMYNIDVKNEFGTQYQQGFSMKKRNHEDANYYN